MDTADFERAYEAHCDSVYRYCAFRTNCAGDAEDITADVFLELFRSRKPPAEGFTLAWLYRVAQRKCATHHRRHSRVVPVEAVPDATSEDRSPWSDDGVWRTVRRLRPAQQLVIYLRAIEGRAFEEIAGLVGKRLGATKMLYYRAIESLRATLAEEGADR